MARIKIAIADDHNMFRQGLIAVLSDTPEFEVIFDVENGRQLINQLDIQRPDVILMDLKMPEMNGIEATEYIQGRFPEIKIIAISMHDDEKFVLKMLRLGAKGYLLKNADAEEVENAIFSVMRNNFYLTELVQIAMLKKMTRDKDIDPKFDSDITLSGRELEVLKLICEEKTSGEIADQLHLSPRTVEGYRKSLMTKIGARNIVGVIVFAFKNGIVD